MKKILVLIAAAAAFPASAQVTLQNQVLTEVAMTAPDGTVTVRREPARSIAPTGVAIYEMTYRNAGPGPATDLVIQNEIPEDMVYLGVDPNGPTPEVSVDGGTTFGDIRALRAPSDASRPAQFSDVTDVRWIIRGPVGPGTAGTVSYRAQVR